LLFLTDFIFLVILRFQGSRVTRQIRKLEALVFKVENILEIQQSKVQMFLGTVWNRTQKS
jgi:hypothetical protein